MRIIGCILSGFVLLGITAINQAGAKHEGQKRQITFANDRAYAKGGIGIITPDLYIVLKSDKNELLLNSGDHWTGETVPTPQVVLVADKKVWSTEHLPSGFDLSKAVVISFEADKVRFFDFSKMQGAFYCREFEPLNLSCYSTGLEQTKPK